MTEKRGSLCFWYSVAAGCIVCCLSAAGVSFAETPRAAGSSKVQMQREGTNADADRESADREIRALTQPSELAAMESPEEADNGHSVMYTPEPVYVETDVPAQIPAAVKSRAAKHDLPPPLPTHNELGIPDGVEPAQTGFPNDKSVSEIAAYRAYIRALGEEDLNENDLLMPLPAIVPRLRERRSSDTPNGNGDLPMPVLERHLNPSGVDDPDL